MVKYNYKNSYSSPELLQENKRLSLIYGNYPKSDIYSMGMLLWELFTNKVPFNVKLKALYNYIVNEKVRPEIPDNLNPILSEVIRRCWDCDINNRPSLSEIDNIISNLI